jgi:L-threonylcarbamoyladenylate synthase
MKENQITKATEVIRNGGVVAYPTDTAYGLGADATNVEAVKKLYELKGRNYTKPIHVIFPSFSELNRVVVLTSITKKIIQKLFPGPLTVVVPLKKSSESWNLLSANTGTLGFRMPDHSLVRALVKALGRPITTTSANRSGRANGYSVKQVKNQFKKAKLKPDYYLNGGKLKRNKPSTVVQIVGNKVKLLREGPISFDEIKNAIR